MFQLVCLYHFNPLPRKEGDRRIYRNLQCRADFNPLPRKEGDAYEIAVQNGYDDFNPLPRKEGDPDGNPPTDTEDISIHSLVKRETATLAFSGKFPAISIHSLVKRETGLHGGDITASGFQSTPS